MLSTAASNMSSSKALCGTLVSTNAPDVKKGVAQVPDAPRIPGHNCTMPLSTPVPQMGRWFLPLRQVLVRSIV